MDMSNFRPDQLHVALQSRRDKLRYQQSAIEEHQLDDAYTDNLEQLSSAHQGLDRDFVQLQSCRYGNISYEPIPFAVSQAALLAHKDGMMVHRECGTNRSDKAVAHEDDASFTNLSQPMSSSSFNFPAKVSGDRDPQNCGTWKSIPSQQHCDWTANYTSRSAGIEGNTSQLYVDEAGLSGAGAGSGVGAGAMKIINSSPSTVDVKPSYFGYHEVQSSMNNPSSEISSQNVLKHYGSVQFDTHSLHQNTLQDVVTSATLGNQEVKIVSFAHQSTKETGGGPWTDVGNELVLLPTYADQSSRVHLDCSSDLVNQPVEGYHQLIGESNYPAEKNFERGFRAIPTDSSSVQALSLSLSSVPQSKMRLDQEAERSISERVHSSSGCLTRIPDSKALKSNYVISNPRSFYGCKLSINSPSDMVGTSSFNHRNVGPLGPFTGYATILRSSKFLRPAQQLLDEFCNVANPKPRRSCEALQGDHRVSGDALKANEPADGTAGGDSGGSTSTFYSSNGKSQEAAVISCSNESVRPEYLQKKAKLIYMQEEVCRRYKQYHQQMQMVVSSFESVAGLSVATPFISLALKTISRHFRCLKNAIFSQLRNIGKALGEDSSCPTTRTINSKGDASTSRVKFFEQTLQKQKAGGGSVGTFESQQHVWRPQRGLPERAVAVLRAWLFDHFLHPYPTDADKHMLASQTGLTRNQVSNWFINARVRVWKPMVEEIHMLEAKGLAESGTNAARTDNEKPCTEGVQGLNHSQQMNKLTSTGVPNMQSRSPDIGSSTSVPDNRSNPDLWNLEKRSRVDCRHPASMDGSLMDFMPYGGLGAVSLTLGLRQSVENAQQQQQLQQPERLQHFGDQVIHDFVG